MLIALSAAALSLDTAGAVDPAVVFQGETVEAVARYEIHEAIALEGGAVLMRRSDAPNEKGWTRVKTGVQEETAAFAFVPNGKVPTLLIGTDDSAFVYALKSADGPAVRNVQFDNLEARKKWYTPWGGPPAVRRFAVTQDGTVYADIHVGSIMRSIDYGATWEPVEPSLHPDVHEIAVSKAKPDRVYANTANAVYVSDDRGATWTHRRDGLPARYGRAVAVHPENPDLVLASVSDGPRGGNGRLFRSENAGADWEHVDNGFPASVNQNIDTKRVAFTSDGSAWAAVGKTLYMSQDGGKTWSIRWESEEAIRALAP